MPLVLRLTDEDRALLGEVEELEDLLVDGGFTAGEDDHLGLALAGDEDVQHPLALLTRDRVPVGLVAGVGEADRAVEVAAGLHLDDAEAGALVLGTQATVARAAVVDLGLELERDRARLVEAHRIRVHLGIAVHDRLELPCSVQRLRR